MSTFLSLLIISPMLESGYTNDDSFNSLVQGVVTLTHQNVFSYTYGQISYCANFIGRFFPIPYFYGPIFFEYVNNLLIYKLLTLFIISLDLITFGYFIRIYTRSSGAAILGILIMPLLFQFRLYHDAILGYEFILPLIVFFTFTSLILLLYYYQNNKVDLLIASYIIYIISVLTYEISYCTLLLYLLVAYFYGRNKKLAIYSIIPYIFISAILALIPIIIRLHNRIAIIGGPGGPAYAPNMDIIQCIHTLIKQTFSAFPLSYYITDPNHIFNTQIFEFIDTDLFILAVIVLGYGRLLLLFYRQYSTDKPTRKIETGKNLLIFLAISGLILLLAPSAMISLSPKYQSEVILGFGYLPVYMSDFGLAMIVISLIYLTYDRIKSKKIIVLITVIIAITCMTTGMINYIDNRNVVEHSNQNWLYPRQIIEDAMRNGLFNNVPNGSTLLVNANNTWDQPSFYSMNTGIKFKEIEANGPLKYVGGGNYNPASLPEDGFLYKNKDIYQYSLRDNDNVFYLCYDAHDREDGYVILSDVKNISISASKIHGITSSYVDIFIRTPFDIHPNDGHQSSFGIWAKGNMISIKNKSIKPFMMTQSQMVLIASSSKWKILRINMQPDWIIDMKSLSLGISSNYPSDSKFFREKDYKFYT